MRPARDPDSRERAAAAAAAAALAPFLHVSAAAAAVAVDSPNTALYAVFGGLLGGSAVGVAAVYTLAKSAGGPWSPGESGERRERIEVVAGQPGQFGRAGTARSIMSANASSEEERLRIEVAQLEGQLEEALMMMGVSDAQLAAAREKAEQAPGQKEMAAVREKVLSMQEELEVAEARVEEEEAKREMFEAKLEVAAAQQETLEAALAIAKAGAQKGLEGMQSQSAEAEQEMQKLQQEIEALKEELSRTAEAEQEMETLQKEIATLKEEQSRSAEAEQEMEKLQNEIDALKEVQNRSAEAEQEMETLQKEIEALNKKLEQQETQITEERNRAAQLRGELAAAAEASVEAQAVQLELKNASDERATLLQNQMATRLEEAKEEIEQRNRVLNELKDRFKSEASAKSVLEKKLAESEARAEEGSSSLAALRTELEAKLAESEARVEERSSSLAGQLEKEVALRTEAQMTLAAQTAQVEEQSEQSERFREQIELSESARAALEDEVEKLNADHAAELKALRNSLEEKVGKETTDIQSERDELAEELRALRNSAEKEKVELEQANESIKEDKDRVEKELAETKAKAEETEAELAQAAEASARVDEAMKQVQDDLVESRNQAGALAGDRVEMLERVKRAEENTSVLEARAEEERTAFASELHRLRSELKKAKDGNAGPETETPAPASEPPTNKVYNRGRDRAMRELQQENLKLQKELSTLAGARDIIATAQQLRDNLAQANARLKAYEESFEANGGEDGENSEGVSRIALLKAALVERELEVESLQAQQSASLAAQRLLEAELAERLLLLDLANADRKELLEQLEQRDGSVSQ